jgi:aspartyl-tRNA(Asn)/glutamyl-tRNA(Gln) amidotransferase subunit B
MKTIEGHTGPWEVVIGLEVHAQVTSNAKLFSSAPTDFGADPNSQVSFVDAAFPGMLPVLNEECVTKAVKTGLGLNAQINKTSVFERKNYFYQDLPQGYQISQNDLPIVGKGILKIELSDGEIREIGITRLHLEQDAGKSLHDQDPNLTFVDLNRSGVALMEIVSEPDMRTAEEAGAYVKKLRSILRYLGTCDGNMDQGSMRCDVNVSVRRPGKPLGTRCEIKNVNSMRFVMQAIEYEAERQIEILEDGGKISQETRLFDSAKSITRSMRSKEDAHDYRYFPDPDLLPLILEDEFIENIRKTIPELPDQKHDRFVNEFGLKSYDASVLTAEKESADYYEATLEGVDPKKAANWVMGELFGLLKKNGVSISESPISPQALNSLLQLLEKGTISGRIAKDVFLEMAETGKGAAAIVKDKGLEQVTDTGAVEKVIAEVLADHPDKIAEYKSGKDKLFGFFVGQVMKKSQGKANPKIVNDILKQQLSS